MGQTCGHTTPKRATQWLKTPHKNSLCARTEDVSYVRTREISHVGMHTRDLARLYANARWVYIWCAVEIFSAHAHKNHRVCMAKTDISFARTREIFCLHTHERSLVRMRAHMCTYSSKRVHPHKSSLARMRTGSHLRACTQVSCRVHALNIDLLCACRHESFEEDHS